MAIIKVEERDYVTAKNTAAVVDYVLEENKRLKEDIERYREDIERLREKLQLASFPQFILKGDE